MHVYNFSYPDDTTITVGVIAVFFGVTVVIAIILAVVVVIQVTTILT